MSPADREHRFGHGKAEPLAVLGQSAFIVGSAMLLLAEAVRRLIWPIPVENPPAGIAVMIFSIAVTIGLVLYQRHVVRRTGSIAISADELHYRGDLVSCRYSIRCLARRSGSGSSGVPCGWRACH